MKHKIILSLSALMLVILACPGANELPAAAAPAAVTPRIISPAAGETYIFGAPISFRAIDDARECDEGRYEFTWSFREAGQVPWQAYSFTPERMLGAFGVDTALPLPGDYEVKVEMCGVESGIVPFTVADAPEVLGQVHPGLNADVSCFVDWDKDRAPNHRVTAHFNVYWNDTGQDCEGDPVPLRVPTDAELGLMECTYAALDRWMISPLDANSIFRNYGDYSDLTHLTYVLGMDEGGGGRGLPQGMGYGVGANARVLIHELFHTFDYAGNPLHNQSFDHPYSNNAYHFYHEAIARIQEVWAPGAGTHWGFRSDRWPVWVALDSGLLELDYDGGPFWAYLINNFGDLFALSPRETWEGPPIDACKDYVQEDVLHNVIRPHSFKLLEAWNARVRAQIQDEIGVGEELAGYPGECADNFPPDEDFLYNGQVEPGCSQTVEYEMQVLEGLINQRVPPAGTPRSESLLLDFALQFAQAFPPASLQTAMPEQVSCDNHAGINYAYGFSAIQPGCPTGPANAFPIPPIVADAPVCAAVANLNEYDFYARIKFRISEDRAKYLRLQANDDATLYIDGRAVIGQDSPFGDDSSAAFPNASTTYADQRYQFARNHAPLSSVFPITGDIDEKIFEIEWVNRGDGKGNSDDRCAAQAHRYLLNLEWYNPLVSDTFHPLEPDQVEILSASFWPGQGSGYPGFSPPADWDGTVIMAGKEIQLRPVSGGETPFLLPGLAVNYHPVACPAGFNGHLEVSVRDDNLTYSDPTVQLFIFKAPDAIDWLPHAVGHDPGSDLYTVSLDCDGQGGPARYGGDPAVLLVTTHRTLHGDPPVNPYGTMGAVHYTVIVDNPVFPRVLLPVLMRNSPVD